MRVRVFTAAVSVVLFFLGGTPVFGDRPGSGGCIVFLTAEQDVQNLVPDQGIANSLVQKLDAAGGAAMAGQIQTSANILQAFEQEVAAQIGQGIAPEVAGALTSDAEFLIGYVMNMD